MNKTVKSDKKQVILSFIFWFSIFYVALFFVGKLGNNDDKQVEKTALMLTSDKASYSLGNLPIFSITNNTDQDVNLPSPCEGGAQSLMLAEIGGMKTISCAEGAVPETIILRHSTTKIPLQAIAGDIFKEVKEYQLIANVVDEQGETKTIKSQTIEFKEPGVMKQLFRALVIKPLFNLLVFFVHVMPNHSIGLAIILLTIIVRLILFVPNQKAMASQRELQRLQPKMNELKEKYKGNQQALSLKTMELYKTHKINPMSSCWPILLQMPFLIGLYRIIVVGLSPHMTYFLYGFQKDADLTVVNNFFLGLDLTIPNIIPLAFLVGGAQWFALRLANMRMKKKNEKTSVKKAAPESMAGQMQNMTKMMEVVMPLMIMFFTTVMPAGVGIYWLTSTIFGIGQQWFVNHQLEKPQVTRRS